MNVGEPAAVRYGRSTLVVMRIPLLHLSQNVGEFVLSPIEVMCKICSSSLSQLQRFVNIFVFLLSVFQKSNN